MFAMLHAAVARWRRRRHARRHPTPHRDPLVPRKRGWADPGGGRAAFMPPPSPRTAGAPSRPLPRSGDDADPPAGTPVPVRRQPHAAPRPAAQH